MNALDDVAMMRATHQEMLVQLMHAVKRRARSTESRRIFVLMLAEDVCEYGPTQPLPRIS